MFNLKEIPASPSLARRLLTFSKVNGLAFDDKIVDLAMDDLVSTQILDGSGLLLSDKELAALQYVLDWRGRAILLSSGQDIGRKIALASLWARPQGQTLIISRPEDYADWVHAILKVWPERSISVFGNPRYCNKVTELSAGIQFSETPDLSADFLVTSYGSVVWHNLPSLDTLKYTIIEELVDQTSVNYKWVESVAGHFKEMPSPLILQDIKSLPLTAGQEIMTSLQSTGSAALEWLGNLASVYLFGGNILPLMLTSQRYSKEVSSYLGQRGYVGHHLFDLLALVGISTDLISDIDHLNCDIKFYDSTVKNLRRTLNKRKDSGLHRLITREAEIETHTGHPMPRTILDALEGDRASMALISSLYSNVWATQKSQHIKQIVDQISTYLSRIIIVTENTDLIRPLRLQLGSTAEHLGPSSPDTIKSRFTDNNAYTMSSNKPLRILIASNSDLLDANLMKSANYLIMADNPSTHREYRQVKDLAIHYGIRIVHSILQGTFEEELNQQLTQKL